ncbi:hypothetical protein [Solibacillus sp. FSL H8-0538]|uniref:hypothetical protein n=1 Tax=Solibacillus sp. FSL H8-0538 TaxID=2921400 RepID=UPI0030FAD04B
MKMKDIKTLITSGTILLAGALYMIFAEPAKENTNVTSPPSQTQTQSTTKQSTNVADYIITPQYATNATGNELIDVEFLSANDGLSL